MTLTFAAFLVLLFASISSGGRTNRIQELCSTKCDGIVDSLFETGKSYTYLYHGESEIKTSTGSYDTSGLLVKSKVTVVGLSSCEMKLKMENVEIFDKTNTNENKFIETPFSNKAKEILEKNEVLFSRSKEEIVSICMNKDEPIWAQNMKKSIIDILANQGKEKLPYQKRKTRHGTCFVNTLISDDLTKTISYNIDSCISPVTQSLFTDLAEAIAFNVSSVNCKYGFQTKNDIQTIHCTEDYNTTPIRTNQNNINIRVITRLEKTKSKGLDMSYPKIDLVKTGIEMEDNNINENNQKYYEATQKTIKLICEQHVSGKKSDIPRTFMNLVNQLKKLTTSQVKEIYMEIHKTDICPGQNEEIKSKFYDAIGFVNTPAATSVMIDLIKNKQISDIDQAVWFTSLSFMQTTPTIEMIKDLESLLNPDNINKQMYLGVSAVTHLYCKDNYESCLMDPTVRNIFSFFLRNIDKNCDASKNKENLSKILISLKSLGNLKLFNEDIVAILSQCVKSKSNPTSIRVSALEVLKHMDCKGDRSAAMEILQNNENDSEMRINSYLTVMGCPDINTMFKVREILSKEKVNQVGSFIWTHLTNIQESNDILKLDIQKLLNDVELKKEFDISKLKFSRNIEKTFKTDRFGMTFDSNVIFSEKSFIPKSLSVNTTAIVINKPTNFIEMSARMEGLDDLLFKLLGPEGYLKKVKPNTADENLALIKLLDEVNGNLNIKLFGQQISFVELIRGTLSSVKKYNIIEELMNIGKEKLMNFKKNLVLLDKVASIPTSLGFPIKFKVQGSVSVTMQIKSKFDLSTLISWPISVNIQSHIAPSIMSSFSSEIILETPFANYGMSMIMDSGTDTEFKTMITFNKNEEFSITFDTPKAKQEIIIVSGKSFVIHRDIKIEQLKNAKEKYELCTQDKLTRVFGVNICGNVEITNSETRNTALLFGPFSANVYIEKEDTQTGYILKGLMKTSAFISENGIMYKNRFIKLEFDTPQSSLFYRKFALEMTVDFKESLMKFQLDTPWNQVLLKSNFKFSDEQKKLLILLQMNNKNIIKIALEHLSFATNAIKTEKGMISFAFMNLKPFETKWIFNGKRNEWMVKFESKGLLKDNTNLRLDVKEVKSTRQLSLINKYKLTGSYETYFGKGKISGAASENYYGHRWDVKLEHSPRENPKNNYIIIYRHKTEDKSSKSLLKYFLTSTISYGKFAENFVKFEIENELSGRHVRAFMKTSYGKSKDDENKDLEKIELQLYGGYTWKDDDRHYAEGSLSFKFPSKSLNYEGRYNSEINKRMFKMAIVLDKDQQSKVNFKINYIQPKLYLKNTECDVILSIPNHNTNLKWVLKEVDVNKYQYSLTGAYNSYEMKIDGTQTEISSLKHDSIIQILLPKIGYWPEKLSGELKVDLVNLHDASLIGKIEIPSYKHKYMFDLKLSLISQNFLQIPISEKSPVFKYNLKISTLTRTIESESIFTCNPEEVQLYLNLKWDVERNKNQQVSFDFHTLHKSSNYKLFNSSARISVIYPGNSHSIGFQSEFKYTELNAQIDLTWNKNQKISIRTNYEIDNSWTQKGLKGYITMKTPFLGMELTHLGINAVGQLRYRKVDIEYKWGNNKKILFDIAVHPKSSNDFTLTSKLVTPFKGVNLISLHARHISTTNSISSQLILELGPKQRYNIKFEGSNNSEGKNRDYASTIYIESGFFYPLKLSVFHKDDKVHFKSNIDISWMKVNYINIKNEFSYTFEETELITNGNLELLSTIDVIKQCKATWQIETKDTTFNNNIQLLYNSNNVLHSVIKGFYEKEESIFKMEFTGLLQIMSSQPLRVTNFLSYDQFSSFVNNFSLKKDTIPTYSHSITIKPIDVSIKLLILNTEFKTVEFKATYKLEGNTETRINWLKVGELYIFKKYEQMVYSEEIKDRKEINIYSEFYSDHMVQKNIISKAKVIYSNGYMYIDVETKSESKVLLKSNFEILVELQKTFIKFFLNSSLKQMRVINFEIESLTFANIFKFNYNDILKASSNIKIKETQFIEIDFLFKYKEFVRYFKLKHDQQLMGYNELLETNIFDTTLKFSISTEERSGLAIHTTLNCNLYFLKSIDVIGRFSKKSHQLDIFYKYPRINGIDEIIKLKYSNKRLLYNFDISSQTLFKSSLSLNLENYKTLNYRFNTLEMEKFDIKINYEGGLNAMKHSNDINLSFGNRNFQLVNRFEKVKWSYLLFESKLKTNIERFINYNIGFDYKLKVDNSDIEMKGFFNDMYVTAKTKLILTTDVKTEFKVTTSFPVMKEIIFEVKHKQNKLLTQVAHTCTISIISNDKKFQLKNKVEWSDVNYINIESLIVAQTSENNYFIKPKSIRFTHEFYKNVLKETFNFELSEEIQIKANLYIPMTLITNSVFEIESSFPILKQFKINFKIDLENTVKFGKLIIERNYNPLVKGNCQLTMTKNEFSMSLNEEIRNDNLGIKYSTKDNFFEKVNIHVKGSDVIDFKFNYSNIVKERHLMLDILVNDKLSFIGKITSDSIITKITYGTKLVHFNVISNKNKFRFISEIKIVNILKIDIQAKQNAYKLNFIFNENSVQISSTPNSATLDINVFKKIVSLKFVEVSTAPYKFELSGLSNVKDWSSFKGNMYFVRGPQNIELTSSFSRDVTDIYNIVLRNIEQSFDLKYETMFDIVKMGALSINYDKEQSNVKIKFEGDSLYTKDIKMELKVSKSEIKGDITSSLEWMKKVLIEGKLTKQNNEIKGNLLINHNKLSKPLKGQITYTSELSSWQVDIDTPFPKPIDKLTVMLRNENGKVNFEFRDGENSLLKTSLDLNLQYKLKLYIEINFPEQLNDIKMKLSTLVNTQDTPYTFEIIAKSNLFQDINFKATWNTLENIYVAMISHPLKKATIKVSNSLESFSINFDFNDKVSTLKLERNMKELNRFKYKLKVASNMYSSSPLNLEISCLHNFDIPKNVFLNFETIWNENVIFSIKLDFQNKEINGFEFKSSLVLNPYNTKYESTLDFTNINYERYTLQYSKLSNSPDNSFTIEFLNKITEIGLLVQTPYEMLKTLDFKIRTIKDLEIWKQIITLNTNSLGKLEMLNEYKQLSSNECITTSRITTPYRYGDIEVQVKLKNKMNDQKVDIKIEMNKSIYKILIMKKEKEYELKINSNNQLLKTFQIRIEYDSGIYKMGTVYNDYEGSFSIKYSRNDILIMLITNTKYAKVISLSLIQLVDDKYQKVTIVKFEKDEETIILNINSKDNSYNWEWNNSFLSYLPNKLEGNLKYDRYPANILLQITNNKSPLLKIFLDEKEFFFNADIQQSKFKVQITKNRLELIFLNDKIFSVIIDLPSRNEINVNAVLNDIQYTVSSKFENNKNEFTIKTATYRNSLDRLFEAYVVINKIDREFDSELNILQSQIMKLKFSDKNTKIRKFTSDVRLLFLTVIFNIEGTLQNDFIDLKLFWNLKFKDNQLTLGSITFSQKWSTPINFSVNLNFPTAVFQIQLIEFDDGTYNIKLFTPYKEINIDMTYIHIFKHSTAQSKLILSLKNEIIGKYEISWDINLSIDPEIIVKFVANELNFKFNIMFKNSVPGEYSLTTTGSILDWEKIKLIVKLEMKENVKVIIKLSTPFVLFRTFSLEKTLWIYSKLEHKFKTIIEYKGYINFKYEGGHEISFIKKIIKLNGNLESDEIRMISLNVEGSKNSNEIDHLFVMDIKENRYGYRINGRFNPLFEGKTEIYTPFHSSGVLVLQGRQNKNGIKIQLGKNNKEISAFEYIESNNVKFIKITPPTDIGKPIAAKYHVKRSKRSIREEVRADIKYGDESLFNFNNKLNIENNKNVVIFKLSSPMFSNKSAELKLMHKFEGDTMFFNHNLKIKDSVENIYKIFGDLYHKNENNFKFTFNVHHPTVGPMHLSFGHKTDQNIHNSHILLKHNGKIIFLHNGKLIFELKGIKGEWESHTPNRHYVIVAYHKGDFDQFVQELSAYYNNEPYIIYKSNIVPEEKSLIEIYLPILNGERVKLTFDKKKRRFVVLFTNTVNEYRFESMDKNGKFKTIFHMNNVKVIDFIIGYGRQPLFINAAYKKHYINLETVLKESSVIVNYNSSFRSFKTVNLQLMKNKIMLDITLNDKLLSFSGEYHFVPNNLFVLIESSLKCFTKASLYVTPTEIKVYFNEYFQILNYVIKQNEYELNTLSNFYVIKVLKVNVEINKEKGKIYGNLLINSFTSDLKFDYSLKGYSLAFNNNNFSPKSIILNLDIKSVKDIKAWIFTLTIDKMKMTKLAAQIIKSRYSIVLNTYFQTSFVLSFDRKNNEFIMSTRQGNKYFNLVSKYQRMSTTEATSVVVDVSLDSSSFYLEKMSIQMTYTTSKTELYLTLSGKFNNHQFGVKCHHANYNVQATVYFNDYMYITRISQPTAKELIYDLITPNNKLKVEMSKKESQYVLKLYFNERDILKIEIEQNSDLSKDILHNSKIWYYKQNIWNLHFDTNFKMYTIKLSKPTTIEIILINEWKNYDGQTVSVWMKYMFAGNLLERGVGVKINIGNAYKFIEMYFENNVHMIKFIKGNDTNFDFQLSTMLINKISKNQWEITVKKLKREKLEIQWTSPNSIRKAIFHQTITNNVRTFLNVELVDQMKLVLKSDTKTNSLSGSLSFFGKRIAIIDIKGNGVKAIINEEGSEDKKIYFEWTKAYQGEWKKDYISTNKLILKQKGLNIDLDVEQQIKMEESLYSVTTKTRCLMIDGSVKTTSIEAILDFTISNVLTIELKNPIIPFKAVLKRYQPNVSSLRYDINMVFNVDKKINGFIEISTANDFGITANLYYNPENDKEFFQMHAKYIDDRQMEVRIFNENQKQKTDFFLILVRLLNEHNIEMTYKLQTDTFSQLKSKINTIRVIMVNKIKHCISVNTKEIMNELQSRYFQFLSIIPNGKVINENVNNVLKIVEIDMNLYFEELKKMLNNNEFYIRTLINIVSREIKRTEQFIFSVYITIRRIIESINYEILFEKIVAMNCFVSRIAYRFAERITYPLKYRILEFADKYFPKLLATIINNFESFTNAFNYTLLSITIKFREVRKMQELVILNNIYKISVHLLMTVKQSLRSIKNGSLYFFAQENKIKALCNKIINIIEIYSSEIMKNLYEYVKQIDEGLYIVTGNRFCAKIKNTFDNIIKYIFSQLKNEGNQNWIKEMILSSIEDSFKKVNFRIQTFTKDLIIPKYIIIDRKFNDMKSLEYVFEVTLPIPLNDIKSIPDFTYISYKKKEIINVIKLVKNMFKEKILSCQNFFELLRWFTPQLQIISFPSYIPDFESYATILRSSVVTFDKRTLQLKSNICKVVLAKDVQFKKWHIELEQNKNGRIYTLIISGKDKVSISIYDRKISINGKETDLPLNIGSTKIMAFGNVVKVKDEILGLTITVDPENDMFTVGISGWYHNKVRGLFGNADNEPFNDMLDDNERLLKSKEFFEIYSNGGKVCDVLNEVDSEKKIINQCPFLRKITCKFIYQCPFSPMAACFDRVDPTKYFQMCIDSTLELESKMDTTICNSTRSYQIQCATLGVHIPVPYPCRKCQVKGEKALAINEYRNIKIKEKVADIVFIVDSGICLFDKVLQLQNIISKIEENLKEKKITSTRYGLITFGGDDVNEAQSHTLNQKLFGSKTEILSSLKSIKFSGETYKDIVGSITLAANYPFINHASKHIVLINCDRCGKSSNKFSVLNEMLEKKFIQFSMMMNFNFQVKDGESKKVIYGADNKNIYTTVSRRGEIANNINRPENDYCYQLAIKRDGVVFNLNFLSSKNEATQKRFIETFATQVSLTAKPARKTSCRCVNDGEYNCVPLDIYAIFPAKKAL